MNAVIVLDTGIHGDNPMGGGQWARMELIRHLKQRVPAYYCFVTYRESILAQLAREIYDEVKIVDYTFVRQRRHHIPLDPRNLLSLVRLFSKAAASLRGAIDAVQKSLRPRRMVIFPNENYSRVVFALNQLWHRNRHKSLTIIDNEFNRGNVDQLLVILYGLTFSMLLAASHAASLPFKFFAGRHLQVIYPGVDVESIRRQAHKTNWRPPSGDYSRKLSVMFSGLLVDIKRPDFAMEVFARFLRQSPGTATLHVCGDGVLAGPVRDLARELNLVEGEDIIFWGHLPREVFLRQLSEANILIHPSVTESFGRVVVEAQALGVPVIVSRAGGLPEVIADGQTGFVVEKDNMEGFVEKLRLLAMDKDLSLQMSRAAFAHAERFDVKVALAAYTRVFQELLEF